MILRKFEATIAGVILLFLLICNSVSAEEVKEWTIGYKGNQNGPSNEVQGENGWYFLYSEERNTDGALDVSQLKECVLSEKGSCWQYYGTGAMWMPEKYAADDYDCNDTKNWWLNDGNGIMKNAGEDAVRGVIAWEAPKSGEYSISVEYIAGTDSYEWEGKTYYISKKEGGDGLTLSLNTKDEVLDKVVCGVVTKKKPDLQEGTMEQQVTLKKGERLYFNDDPGESGNGDTVTIKANIRLEKAGFSIPTIAMDGKVVLLLIGIGGILIGILFQVIRDRLV